MKATALYVRILFDRLNKGRDPVKDYVEGLIEMSELESPWPTVWTIGHSTRSGADLIHILKAHEVRTLIDVRSIPGSRRYHQFNSSELAESLEGDGIAYYHLPTLGGRRRPSPDSKNTAWRNPSFRAYADHMEKLEFKEGIEELRELSRRSTAAVMCAEALWWRCHRSLIADYLKALGATVIHLRDESHTQIHPYTSAARVIQGRLSYEGLFPREPDEESSNAKV
ncbi:hypothetical protein BH18ACI4_BH18ACI4_01180 [soil metagenome]